jgi:hypothetical protein
MLFHVEKAAKLVEGSGLNKMNVWVGEGPMTFRVASLIGGFIMIINGFFGFFGSFFGLRLLRAILSFYTLGFGFVIVMLEGRGMLYPPSVKKVISKHAKFLTMLNGRGAFYVFVGTLLMAQWPDYGDAALGMYMVVVGFIMFVVGYHSKQKLDAIRVMLKDEKLVKAAFDTADEDKNGALEPGQLSILCTNLGSTLEPQELEAALQTLDKDGSGKVEYSEFLAWWKGGGGTGIKEYMY